MSYSKLFSDATASMLKRATPGVKSGVLFMTTLTHRLLTITTKASSAATDVTRKVMDQLSSEGKSE